MISTVTRLWTGWFRVQILVGAGDFLFSKRSRPAMGPTQPPFQWVPDFFPRNKAAEARS